MGTGSIQKRIMTIIGFAMALCVVFSLFVSFVSLRQTHLISSVSRLTVIGAAIREEIEAYIGVGIPLAQISEIQAVIERQYAQQRGIDRIDVFGDNAKRLFSSERASIGEEVPHSWFDEQGQIHVEQWTEFDDDGMVVILPIANTFDQLVGGIALRVTYASSFEDLRLPALIVGVAVGFSGLAWAMGWLVVMLILDRDRRYYKLCTHVFTSLRQKEQITDDPGMVSTVVSAVKETTDHLVEADRAIDHVDENIDEKMLGGGT